ncbi:branched-chain amino acid ABC transporter permease [Candidatus Liberibacter africanus]|uniref:ABC transporter membrane spanning protein n=1 Tax=Candidatus Liberibacter africanus PTSAPSY TaxID=1277257 RepID=A0A0G3I3J3_LIBAF|nr:branched-chain amino acid ABC transporter permease [Candidatus Liberibacter africanus]AKK20426.1 ABC transporter membrane spanning protein [Candidatus Liberibacter africanus PTSAPSY]QTP64150.1 branched-chain amino acid ABC transporter permease [Candidatus Liberibacter africanus]
MLKFFSKLNKYDKLLCILAMVYPIALMFFFGANKAQRYIDNMGIQILIYVMLAWGLSIVVGSAGLFSLNCVVSYAVGAYSYVILGKYYDISPWLLVPLSSIISGAFGIVLGLPSLKFRGDYLAIATLVMSEVFQNILIHWKSITNGKMGLYVSDHLVFFGVNLRSCTNFFRYPSSLFIYKTFMYYVLLILCFLLAWTILWLRRTFIGNAWRTIRDNQRAFLSFNTTIIFAKLSAFAVSSMFAGIAGSFFAASQKIISPDMFKFSENIIIISLVFLGGMTSLSKISKAAIIVVGGIEFFCGFDFYYLNSLLKFDCSFNTRHTVLMIVSLFLVIVLRSHSLLRLRHPSPFVDLKK